MNFILLTLTCSTTKEAEYIAHELLKLRLIACAKRISCESQFIWQDSIDHSNEVFLIMESILENFEKVESLLKELHSYETFVLTATPILKVSSDAKKWLEMNLINDDAKSPN